MEQKTMSIELREKNGKGVARKLRAQDVVPGVVYGKGIEPVSVKVAAKDLAATIAGEGGLNSLITLSGGGSLNGNIVIVADMQRNPLKGDILHVDFHRISLDEKVKVHVPVVMVGTAAGVKEGGMLDVVTYSLDVECLPTAIPEAINVDVTNLAIGHSIHVSELVLPAGIKVLNDPETPIVSIHGKAKEEAPVAE
ncbi:50S ribosomal protein L25 [Geobacter sulfurreducens]|uniref:50S ribosomal protein L25 n=1 Tax=Geobacter sulfurreducens TaxID=35554 RepID=UPI0020B86E79|nr:50S ribosomal protein L25 [Geobacter sulfurreducens]UTG93355.1 50S ribosomal protein L25 [Geobacter sulfurreducens]